MATEKSFPATVRQLRPLARTDVAARDQTQFRGDCARSGHWKTPRARQPPVDPPGSRWERRRMLDTTNVAKPIPALPTLSCGRPATRRTPRGSGSLRFPRRKRRDHSPALEGYHRSPGNTCRLKRRPLPAVPTGNGFHLMVPSTPSPHRSARACRAVAPVCRWLGGKGEPLMARIRSD